MGGEDGGVAVEGRNGSEVLIRAGVEATSVTWSRAKACNANVPIKSHNRRRGVPVVLGGGVLGAVLYESMVSVGYG